MYRSLVFVALLACSAPALAQDETLLGNDISFGGYGGPVVRFTPIRHELGILIGGYGGCIINHHFMIGGGGYGLVNNVRAGSEAETAYGHGNPLYIEFGYGGLMLEYVAMPSRLVHWNAQCLIGGGAVRYRDRRIGDGFGGAGDGMITSDDAVFVLEPAVSCEVNLTTWFRVAAGASYRHVDGADALIGIVDGDLGGFSANLALKFGLF